MEGQLARFHNLDLSLAGRVVLDESMFVGLNLRALRRQNHAIFIAHIAVNCVVGCRVGC